MDKFEWQFEDMDAPPTIMESSINNAIATTMHQDEVDLLINQLADESSIELDQRDLSAPVIQLRKTIGWPKIASPVASNLMPNAEPQLFHYETFIQPIKTRCDPPVILQ